MDYLNIFEETKTRLLNVKSKITKEETELILTKEELSYHEDINGLKISNELFKFYNNLKGVLMSSLTVGKCYSIQPQGTKVGYPERDNDQELFNDKSF